MPRKLTLTAALTLNLLCVGGTYIWGKFTLLHIPPLAVGVLRFSLAAVLLYLGTRIFYPQIQIHREDIKRFLLLGILVIPGNQLFFLFGLNFTTPAHSALMYSTLPVFIYLISLSLKEESFAWLKNIGIVTAFLGVYVILNERGIDFSSDYVAGDLLILVAVVSWAFYTVLGRSLIRKYGAFFVTARALGFGTLMFLPFGIYGSIGFDFSAPPVTAYLGIVYMATMTSMVAYTIWYWALKYMDASKVGVVNNFQPVVTALMSFVLFGEHLTQTFIIGGSVVFIGVYLTLKG
ncbi:MAG: EamA family transporter [candidate division Zixibacteria bacterium]|nr:EamA family transporter [candidate division Zixibacteria bacterium]